MAKNPIRILVADDHTLLRRLLVEMIGNREDIAVVDEARDGLEAVEKAKEIEPDVILMDICMPRLDGIQAARVIAEILPQTAVIMLTVSEDYADLTESLKAGARGYLLKDVEPQELARAVCAARKGGYAISPIMTSRLLSGLRLAPGKRKPRSSLDEFGLTEREGEILDLMARGVSNTDIAKRLSISEATVKTHVHRVLNKLGLDNRTQAAAYALQHNWGKVGRDLIGALSEAPQLHA